MVLLRQAKTVFLGVISCLLLLSACGKRGPKETRLQRAERIISAAAEKYKQEITLVSSEKDGKKVKKQLGKIVEDCPIKWKTIDTINTVFVGQSYSPDKTPFHRYVEQLDADIELLNGNEGFLVKGGFAVLLEQSSDLRCMLLEIKQYLLKHKEYKAEERFAALRSELTNHRRY